MPSHDFNTRSQTGPILFIYWIWSVYLLKEVFAVQYMCDPHLGNQHASVKIDESGWAWLVTGRKLFIWRYSPTSGAKVSVKIDIPVSCTYSKCKAHAVSSIILLHTYDPPDDDDKHT